MRPIKWKEILQGLTIFYQIMSQYNSVESLLKMSQIFFYIADFSKSARWMFLFLLVICYHTPILHKTAEKPTVIWLFTQNYFKRTVSEKKEKNNRRYQAMSQDTQWRDEYHSTTKNRLAPYLFLRINTYTLHGLIPWLLALPKIG